jgi:hypothetical protein
VGNAVMYAQGSAGGADQPPPAQAPAAPNAPVAPTSPDVIVGGETPAPGVITIQRGGKTITINGATGGVGGGSGGDFSGSTGFPFPSDIPPGVQSLASTAIIGFCLMVAAYPVFGFLKALVNRSASRQQLSPPRDTTDRLQRIEAAVEAMSVEVERISEGQRFVTRVLSERSSAQT